MSSSSLHSVILLPPPPQQVTAASLKAAYRPPLEAALRQLSLLRLSSSVVLEIAIPCPTLCGRLENPRSHLFEETQHLLAGCYSLISVIFAQNSIEPLEPGGIDAQILLLAHDISKESNTKAQRSTAQSSSGGPIIDLYTFASSRYQWQYIFTVEGDQGEIFLSQYKDIVSSNNVPLRGILQKLTRGIILLSGKAGVGGGVSPHQSSTVHTVVIVGGTFDHLHAGHKLLLSGTALLLQPSYHSQIHPRRLIVGISGDELLKSKKFAEYLQSWKQRQDDVVAFLTSLLNFPNHHDGSDVETLLFDEPVVNGKAIHTYLKQSGITIECVEIQDPYGPTITDESVSALIVSGETRDGGASVNEKRKEKGWKTLEVYEVDVLDAEDIADGEQHSNNTENFTAKISSTAIRRKMAASTPSSSL